MIWPATEEVNFTPTSSGVPSFKLNRLGLGGEPVALILSVAGFDVKLTLSSEARASMICVPSPAAVHE
ncbi:hypothetical protein [Nitrobacter hamburgensis]|uniref:hypothetical protein n=1 Tax=Nitrobacter hamburgensis TaxID=912 RepID=UPI00059B87C6|nr:hypothetical protein [Nitrobacter hamburgensis]